MIIVWHLVFIRFLLLLLDFVMKWNPGCSYSGQRIEHTSRLITNLSSIICHCMRARNKGINMRVSILFLFISLSFCIDNWNYWDFWVAMINKQSTYNQVHIINFLFTLTVDSIGFDIKPQWYGLIWFQKSYEEEAKKKEKHTTIGWNKLSGDLNSYTTTKRKKKKQNNINEISNDKRLFLAYHEHSFWNKWIWQKRVCFVSRSSTMIGIF